ncbi:MAG: SMP-30/gluconolactonase/LRE family protein, partial [Roseibium sp.]
YADDLDIAPDGSVYFTDASTKFGAQQNGGTLPASLLDLMEHGPNGRVLRYDPATDETTSMLEGLSFANGLALTQSGEHYLVVETGTYSVLKVALDGTSEPVTIVENLPGFPDNINRNSDGTFWMGIVSPRSPVADAIADKPSLRKVVMRLPAFIRPAAQRYGFLVKINEAGDILETLQDPSGSYALTTGLIEGEGGTQFITSLTEPDLGVLKP